MEWLQLAEYAYHNCQFAAASRHLEEFPASAEAAILRVRCLCELDQAPLAKAYAGLAQRDFPASGALHYHRGMAAYLSFSPRQDLEAAFDAALKYGFSGAFLGRSFLTYSDGRAAEALCQLEQAVGLRGELEHVRQLMACQILLDEGKFTAAEERLAAADQVLRQSPSLLRSLWGQLCWVRLLTASGGFDLAAKAVGRIAEQVSADQTPRLYRNVELLRGQISRREGASVINLPAQDVLSRVFPPDEVLRKPVLNSLWHALSACGLGGATKEELVAKVWEQPYRPMVHDDRLYKSIGRLRKLLGDDLECPRLIYLRGSSYVLDLEQFRAVRTARPRESEPCATSST